MSIGVVALLVTFMVPGLLIIGNKVRCAGKIYGHFAKKDKSLDTKLCKLASSFVIYEDRAFDLYPDYVRLTRYPAGWPKPFQELVPCALWDEEDAVQKDWITLEPPKEGSLSLRAALDENWIKKLVAESASEGSTRFNWRKVLPIALLIIGGLGLVSIIAMKGCAGVPVPTG